MPRSMRRRWLLIAAGATLFLLLAGTGVVVAYDHARRDTIAAGVRVDGVDVGGLDSAQAARRLRAELLARLSRPVRVVYHRHRFTLTPRAAAVTVDIQGSVARALNRSREGNTFSRTWRSIEGGRVRADIPAAISWSRPAVHRLVARVRRRVNRPARDASIGLSTGRLERRRAITGRRLYARRLARAVERTLLDPGPRHPVRVTGRVVRPKVTTAQLADRYPAVIIINRSAFTLKLYKHLRLAKTYPIAVGMVGLETPAGLYHVQNKAINPAWSVPNSPWAGSMAGQVIPGGAPDNPIKARWLGIYAGAGIHGTAEDGSIGSAASHGCIRMHIADVEELYPQVRVGAPVYIS
jgi:lipoprotein-anchoring transpeptidase ErfK/SrfK